jgi:hypothetical protein
MTRIASLAVLLSALAACGGDDDAADAGPIDARPPGGTFALTWSVTDLDDAALDCDDVGGASVVVIGVPSSSVTGFQEIFSCGTGAGTSGQVDPGTYALTVDLRTADGDSLLEAPIELPTIEIARDEEVAAGSPTFAVDPTGSLSFTIDAEGDGDNCATDPMDGATVNQVSIEVLDVDLDDCVELTFDVDGTDYVSDCATPLLVDCIPNDQVVSLTGVASGRYAITVSGTKVDFGGEVCYSNTVQLTIPGNGLTLEHDAILLDSSDAPECTPT